MSHAQNLRMNDVRAVFRLLGEVCELGVSASSWRPHMLERLCGMLDATRAHAGEAPVPCSPVKPSFRGIVISGVDETGLRQVYHGLIWERDYSDDPCTEAMKGLIRGSFTRTRQQMAPDRAWYLRRDLDAWRTLGADCFIYSHQLVPAHNCLHLISLNRSWGKPAFSERARRTVELFHSELGRLWDERRDDPAAGLSPRARETLRWLTDGWSEKEIAVRMGIKRYTVHQYVKAVYAHLGVSSHAQLLARLARDRIRQAPRLSSQ